MTGRRELLRTLLFALAAAPSARLLGTTPAAAAAPAPAAARSFVIVNGWVLTEADVARIADAV